MLYSFKGVVCACLAGSVYPLHFGRGFRHALPNAHVATGDRRQRSCFSSCGVVTSPVLPVSLRRFIDSEGLARRGHERPRSDYGADGDRNCDTADHQSAPRIFEPWVKLVVRHSDITHGRVLGLYRAFPVTRRLQNSLSGGNPTKRTLKRVAESSTQRPVCRISRQRRWWPQREGQFGKPAGLGGLCYKWRGGHVESTRRATMPA
jgi:hypothetical protein